jgi:hypothetical protein
MLIAHQTPPAALFRSKTVTSIPVALRCAAVTTPLIPAPIIATRLVLIGDMVANKQSQNQGRTKLGDGKPDICISILREKKPIIISPARSLHLAPNTGLYNPKYCTIDTYFAYFAYFANNESSLTNADRDVMLQYLHRIVNHRTLILIAAHLQTHDNAKDKKYRPIACAFQPNDPGRFLV